MEILTYLIAVALGVAFKVHVLFGSRKRARTIAGELILAWDESRGRVSRIFRLLNVLIAFGLGGLFVAFYCLIDMQHSLAELILPILFFASPRAFVRRTELRQNGILRIDYQKVSLEPWTSIRFVRWLRPPDVLCFQMDQERRTEIIPEEAQSEIEPALGRFVEVRDRDDNVLCRPERRAAAVAEEDLKVPRFQFDLRTLLLFMLVVSAASSWYGIGYRKKQQEDAVLVQLAEFKPKVQWIGNDLSLDFSVPGASTTLHDDDLARLAGLPDLHSLNLGNLPATDALIPALERCHNLRFVWLSGTQITVAGKERLQRSLPHCKVY